jgi:hypothetical protein
VGGLQPCQALLASCPLSIRTFHYCIHLKRSTASCRSALQSEKHHMYESAYQVGRHLTRHSGRYNTLSDNAIFIAVELFSADRKVTTTSVNDHTLRRCENKFKARNRIRLLNMVCLFLYKIKKNTGIIRIIRAILSPTYNLCDKKIFSRMTI